MKQPQERAQRDDKKKTLQEQFLQLFSIMRQGKWESLVTHVTAVEASFPPRGTIKQNFYKTM